jgi:hypothetical protein
MILALIFEPVIANQHGVGVSAPLAHQHRAGLRYDAGSEGCTGFLELSGQGLQTAPLRPARAAFGSLLPLMSKGSDHQIATETRRWSGAMQLPPGKPQIVRRSLDEPGNVACELGAVCTTRPVVAIGAAPGNRRRPARVLASRSVIDCGFHTLAGPLMR